MNAPDVSLQGASRAWVKQWLLSLSVGLALWLGVGAPALALPLVQRSAFAVVVGVNQSLQSRRPDLHYADDDAARYFELFETIAPGRTTLLSDFDRDTERLFAESKSRAQHPTRAALLAVGAELKGQVQAANAAGQETELYFVFAGHGDVEGGNGFIELADGRFTSDDLEKWLRAIPFKRAHVVLDSCNSFFMLGVRKPGGRYFATPEDAVRTLAGRLPNVGVFLSTSAEGETFEWSEIQSGIFSHLVRSGLLGAADANADGAVSYLELAAFVATATSDVLNPNMRPRIYARGPSAENKSAILRLTERVGATGYRLSDPASLRIRILDREGIPILDTHTEAGTRLAFSLPKAWTPGAMIEASAGLGAVPAEQNSRGEPTSAATEAHAAASKTPRGDLLAFELPELPAAGTPLVLATLQPASVDSRARGAGDLFHKLYSQPFGPQAVDKYAAAQQMQPVAVFGVSNEKAQRMDLLLGEIAGAERSQRRMKGGVALGLGAIGGFGSLMFLGLDARALGVSQTRAYSILGVGAGLSVLALAYGGYTLATSSAGEQAALDYRAALKGREGYGHAFAAADERLREMTVHQRRMRLALALTGTSSILGGVAIAAIASLSDSLNAQKQLVSGLAAGSLVIVGGCLLASGLTQSPVERLSKVWRKDPSLLQFQPTFSVTRKGAVLGALLKF